MVQYFGRWASDTVRGYVEEAYAEHTVRWAQQSAENFCAAATRVWTAAECLKKAGAPPDAPLVLRRQTPDHWVLLTSGTLSIATWVAPVHDTASKLALAVLISGECANE